MKYCEHCVEKLDSSVNYCPDCNAKVENRKVINGMVVRNSHT